jgi:hypothetical protein
MIVVVVIYYFVSFHNLTVAPGPSWAYRLWHDERSESRYVLLVNNTNQQLGPVHINKQGYPIAQALRDPTLPCVDDQQTPPATGRTVGNGKVG